MTILSELGKVLDSRTMRTIMPPLLVGSAVAMGVHSHYKHETPAPGDPNKPGLFTSIKEGLFDFAMGDPYADVHMLGFPVAPVDLLGPLIPAPQAAIDVGRAVDATRWAYDNPEFGGIQKILQGSMYSDRLNRWYQSQAAANVKRRYTTIDDGNYSNYPYIPTYQNQAMNSSRIDTGVTATGDMVFGAYNLRHS